ncbi:GDSL esterase/lipase At5g45910-like [Lathyrus oleraceus]|uniref:GDSL esterase/lipase At5g45910-like n=1 Tax=Pisum sativum TaxID=3888 RepID=UPI0021CED9B6|nr:GDSL esterase/lipase At5g45910-like [Pisum sativum]
MTYNNNMKFLILFSLTFIFRNVLSNVNPLPYEAIFNFGDSISDTGNEATLHPPMPINSPYGSTYFKHPSGRLSNGRLIIDFIAQAYGLPFLPAYKNLIEGQDITEGVNFAFAGATALDFNYFNKSMVALPGTNNSLSVQLKMFKRLKPSLCKNKKDCRNYFKKSLFLVGEIGGNDIFSHITPKFSNFRNLIPLVVNKITETTITLIKEGAVEIVIPGNFPVGCSASLLAVVNTNNTKNYDEFGCFKAFNTVIQYFNDNLIYSITTLRETYPDVKIIYFDYYNNAKRLYEEPQKYGFDKDETFKACCGGGGPYNFDPRMGCGSPNTTVCSDPSKNINWDGVHFTEVAYKLLAKGLVEGPFAYPSLKPAPFQIA